VNNIRYSYNLSCFSTCPSGTYISGYFCLLCDSSANCATCVSAPSLCTSCSGGLYLSKPGNGTCIATCAGTSYFLLDTVNLVCVASCPSNMIAPGNGTCMLCASGYQYQGNCLGTCPGQYYPDATLKVCLQCHSSCLTCLGSYP
jgi:proprotein convertase subtilisin/kexin type 5